MTGKLLWDLQRGPMDDSSALGPSLQDTSLNQSLNAEPIKIEEADPVR